MKIFTYKDYIYSIHTYRLHAVMGLAEYNESYGIEKKYIKDKPNQSLKIILNNTKEVCKFINQFLNIKKEIQAEELEKYNMIYINSNNQKKTADIVYKIKNKPIYYLIEHQETINYNISYRILNYCIEIMQECVKGKRVGKHNTYPIVIPIVLYTGKNKWKTTNNCTNVKTKETTYGSNYIHFSYNLIDINKYSKKYLIQKNSVFAYSMLIEKAKDTEELIATIEMILKHIKNKEELSQMVKIIQNFYITSLELEKQEILKKQLQENVCKK